MKIHLSTGPDTGLFLHYSVTVSGVNSLSGVITSPEWPVGFHRYYPTSCIWKIKALEGFVIQLNLVYADKVFESILKSCGRSPYLQIIGSYLKFRF